MLKKITIAVLLVILIATAIVFFYRNAIIKHYAEKIVKENLPGYIKIDSINFDFADNKVSLKNFRILNPPEFSSQFFLKIDTISCKYGILGNGIPKGLVISEVVLSGADIKIERLKDGRVNAAEMDRFVQSFSTDMNKPQKSTSAAAKENVMNKKLSDMIKLPSSFDIRKSKIAFIDKMPYQEPYITTVEAVNGQFSLGFINDYSKITNVSFTLSGHLNDQLKEEISWVGSINPTTPRITMSNRFDVSNLNILAFEPYYYNFSPFVFKRGRFSGTLVFDFNNGNIGSTNEIHLSDLAFYVKQGYENSQIWDTTVPDLMRYFTTTSGEIVFDFKIKGDMTKPIFYLGPISKRALTSMAIDKIASYAIEQTTKQKQGGSSDIDKTKEAIDMFRQLMKKN